MLCEFLLFGCAVYFMGYSIVCCFNPPMGIDYHFVLIDDVDTDADADADTKDPIETMKTLKALDAFLPKIPLGKEGKEGKEDGKDKHISDIDECAICMGHEGESARILKCGHIFCEVCLFEWFKKGALRCPLCNQSVGVAGVAGVASASSGSSRYINETEDVPPLDVGRSSNGRPSYLIE